MSESRIDRAVARIDAALSRMNGAHENAVAKAAEKASAAHADDAAGSARVMELVNAHEKLREEVAETLRDLDGLIGELEG